MLPPCRGLNDGNRLSDRASLTADDAARCDGMS